VEDSDRNPKKNSKGDSKEKRLEPKGSAQGIRIDLITKSTKVKSKN